MNALRTIQNMLAMTQFKRLLRLVFPHDDAPEALLVVRSMVAMEELSRDFVYTVEIYSDDPNIELKDLIGKMVNIELDRDDGSKRHFNGYVFEFSYEGTDGGLARYRMVLRPWLAFLTKRKNFRIQHQKNIEEQTTTIFDEYALYRDWKTGVFLNPDPVMTDAIQFGETDYNYVHRRWEDFGWHYCYEHTEGGHKLVLSDDSVSAKPIDGNPNIVYRTGTGSMQANVINELKPMRQVASTLFAGSSFDFKAPLPEFAEMPTNNEQGTAAPLKAMEVYEYTGGYGFTKGRDGKKLTEIRIQEIESRAKKFQGRGTSSFMIPGRTFTLDNADYQSENFARGDDLNFLITRVKHIITNNYEQNDRGATYYNHFECIRKRVPWRPGRGWNSTATKIMAPQTALVVGNQDDHEIHTDEYGRVRVQFHWDREGQNNSASSAYVRVAYGMAGDRYGHMMLPRIGEEVIVEFIGGSTDRPIITGRVYNQEKMPPWELPSQQNLMGIRSKEIEGNGWNNLTLDDTTGMVQLQFSSTHELTQLNMGYIVRLVGTEGRKDYRGEGFELRTDAWGSIRAGKGMYISSDLRENARSIQRDMDEAIRELEHSLSLAKSLKAAADGAGAKPADTDDPQSQLDNVYTDLNQAGILISSPQGIAVSSPKSVQFSTQKNLTITSRKSTDLSAHKDVRLGAKDTVSVYAAEKDMKLVAGKNIMEVHANSNKMEVVAKKALRAHSVSADCQIGAPKKILLASGGAFIEIAGGKVTLGAPGGVTVKAPKFNVISPASKSVTTGLAGAQAVPVKSLTPIPGQTDTELKSVQPTEGKDPGITYGKTPDNVSRGEMLPEVVAKPVIPDKRKHYVTIVPLRYAAICSEDQETVKKLTPDFPGDLGQDLLGDGKQLKAGRYGVRTLREGYLYVLANRSGWQYEVAAEVRASGYLDELYTTSKDGSATKIVSDKAECDFIGLPYIKLRKSEDCTEVRVLFTPDKLTDAMLKKLKSDAELRDKMQLVNVSDAKGKDKLDHDLFKKHVAEAIAFSTGSGTAGNNWDMSATFNKEFSVLMEEPHTTYSSHPEKDALRTAHTRLVAEKEKTDGEVGEPRFAAFALVLNDPIGITQTLNTWRNRAIEDELNIWMMKETEDRGIKVSNKRKLEVARSFLDYQAAYPFYCDKKALQARLDQASRDITGKVSTPGVYRRLDDMVAVSPHDQAKLAAAQQQINDNASQLLKQDREALIQKMVGAQSADSIKELEAKRLEYAIGGTNSPEEIEALLKEDKAQLAAEQATIEKGIRKAVEESDPYALFFQQKYIDSGWVDVEAMKAVVAEFDKVLEAANSKFAKRIDDHDVWAESENLLAALDSYDNKDINNGFRFVYQAGLCIQGADGAPKFAQFQSACINGSPTERKNLFARGFAFNQTEIQEEMQTVTQQVEKLAVEAGEEVFGFITASTNVLKTLNELFSKVEEAFVSLNTSEQGKINGASMIFYSGMVQELMSTALAKKMDGILQSRFLRGWVIAATGRLAADLRVVELAQDGRIANPINVRRGMSSNLDKLLLNGNINEFAKIRGGTLLVAFETIQLLAHANSMPADEKNKWAMTLAANIMAATGALFELGKRFSEAMLDESIAKTLKIDIGELTDEKRTKHLGSSRATASQKGMQFTGSRWGLAGGALASAAAFTMAAADVFKLVELRSEKNPLFFAYGLRSLGSGAIGFSTLTTALKGAQPVANWVSGKLGQNLLSNSFQYIVNMAGELAAKRFMAWMVPGGIVVQLGISALIYFLEDEPMEDWCKHSIYRGKDNKSNKDFKTEYTPYASLDDELLKLSSAVGGE